MRRLQALRQGLGLTQVELAKRAGLHIADLSRLECGHWPGYRSRRWRERLCKALGWPEERWKELLEEVEDPYMEEVRSNAAEELGRTAGFTDCQ